jgi:hypothetical protein
MDNVANVVELLGQQTTLENQILNAARDPRSRRSGHSPPHAGGSGGSN